MSGLKTVIETAIVLLVLSACTHSAPSHPAAPAPLRSCYSTNLDAGACHGNVWVPS